MMPKLCTEIYGSSEKKRQKMIVNLCLFLLFPVSNVPIEIEKKDKKRKYVEKCANMQK